MSIETGEVLQGRLPRTAARLVQEWSQHRRAELLANWQRARSFEPLELIPGADDD